MNAPGPLRVGLAQQGVWDMPLESMPLACGYLKAMALADPVLRNSVRIDISNFRGGVTHVQMAAELFRQGAPQVLGFSVFGWNFRAAGSLTETYKHLRPDGWAIWGGTHVSDQAERVFRLFPEVDVVVNGEGELTFAELLHARLAGCSPHELGHIAGISWRAPDGTVVTNTPRARIDDLDSIPSPILTGAIELTDPSGSFRYDVALIETNRGCPYHCSFCYWGGAVGQRVRAFSRARLRAELELLAKLKVRTVVACDANFGMLPIDLEFVDDLIDIKARYGFPCAFESSWAKNKSGIFYEIVRRMKNAGLTSSFTLALQSLAQDAIGTMNRRNMKVNDWHELAGWLRREGLDCYAELIWGVPGETVESFLKGYDELSAWVARIAVYPLMLLPNTEYAEHKEQYGLVTVRGDNDDFEYVLAHSTMTFGDNDLVQEFLFWARVLAENAVLRHLWGPVRALAGLCQSEVIRSFTEWLGRTGLPAVAPLRVAADRSHGGGAPAVATAIGFLFADAHGNEVLTRWWAEAISPSLAAQVRPLLDEIFRYDLLTKPICGDDRDGQPAPGEGDGELRIVSAGAEQYWLRSGVVLRYDVPTALADVRAGRLPNLEPELTVLDLCYRLGALNAVRSTNHEEIMHFMGFLAAQVLT